MRISPKLALVSAALVLAVGNVALGQFRGSAAHHAASAAEVARPHEITPFALAKLLAEGPPDVVVVTLDEPRHPLRGALPLAAFGGTDHGLVDAAPKARRIVVAGFDVVRTDHVARELLASGRDVTVLVDAANSLGSGLEAWDRTMDADPAPPAASALASAWQTYRLDVALRHSFGDAAPAAAAVIVPVGPVVVGQGGAPKKREGC